MQHQLAALTVQAHRLVANLAHQEYWLARRLVERQGQLVLGPGRLNRFSNLAFRSKETVRRHGVSDPLVGPEMVVVVDPESEAFLRFQQFLGFDAGPEFLAHRAPEAFTLAQGLGVVRPGHHMLDALFGQKLLELTLAPPCVILTPLVRQQLFGLSKALYALQKGLLHKVRGLFHPQLPGHHVTAEIVHERDKVYPLAVARQDKAGDVRLPQFAGLGPFKAPDHRLVAPALVRGFALGELFLLDDPLDLRKEPAIPW